MEKLEQLKKLIQKTKKVKFTDSDFVGKVSKIYKKNFITRAKEDLYTSGKVYKLNTGKFYKGFYHIHKDGTIMTGKKHTDKSYSMSNSSGWHSEYFDSNDYSKKSYYLNQLSEIIGKFFSKEILKVDTRVEPDTLWANINNKNCYTHM